MYEVRYQKHAARQLLRMPRNVAQRIRAGIETVAGSPHESHPNATRLQGRDGGFRLRTGDRRVIYFLDNERMVLLVAKTDRRGRVYR